MSAKIFKVGDHATTPELLLEMVKANNTDIKSVVVSVSCECDDGENYQATYFTQMKLSDLAFHLVAITHDLQKEIMGSDERANL